LLILGLFVQLAFFYNFLHDHIIIPSIAFYITHFASQTRKYTLMSKLSRWWLTSVGQF